MIWIIFLKLQDGVSKKQCRINMLRPYFERTNEGVVKPIATVAMI